MKKIYYIYVCLGVLLLTALPAKAANFPNSASEAGGFDSGSIDKSLCVFHFSNHKVIAILMGTQSCK